MDAAAAAQIALNKAQTTQIYAGLKLWPADVMARLVESQLGEDGVFPGAEAIFAAEKAAAGVVADGVAAAQRADFRGTASDFDPAQPRDPVGRWTAGAGTASSSPNSDPTINPPHLTGTAHVQASATPHQPSQIKSNSQTLLGSILNILNPIGPASAQEVPPEEMGPEEENGRRPEEISDPLAEVRSERYSEARMALRIIDPANPELSTISPSKYVPSEGDISRIEFALKTAIAARQSVGPPSQELPGPLENSIGKAEPSGRSLAPLTRIHPDTTYETDNNAKRALEYWRQQPTDVIVRTLRDNPEEPLLVKPDGRIFNGNTMIKVLQERGYPVDQLPRTILP